MGKQQTRQRKNSHLGAQEILIHLQAKTLPQIFPRPSLAFLPWSCSHSCCVCLLFDWRVWPFPCAETLPKALVFLEDGLILSGEASFPPCFWQKEWLATPLSSLFWGPRHWAHTWGSFAARRRRWESCWYISAGFVKNNSRHYKVCVINMHMRYLWGRAAFKVYFQQDNIFPREAGTTVNHMCGREKPVGYVQYLLPLCLASLSPAPPPSHFINGFCSYWKQCITSKEKSVTGWQIIGWRGRRKVACEKQGGDCHGKMKFLKQGYSRIRGGQQSSWG